MIPFGLPIPGIKTIAAIVLITALAAGGWWAYSAGKKAVQSAWDVERQESVRLVRQQQDANRATARAAEIRYVERETVRTEFLTITQKELRDEAENLSRCNLDVGDLRVLQRAASCAREDRPASCGSGEQVPAAR